MTKVEKYEKIIKENQKEIIALKNKSGSKDRIEFLTETNECLSNILEQYEHIEKIEESLKSKKIESSSAKENIKYYKKKIKESKKKIAALNGSGNIFSSLIGQVDKKFHNWFYNDTKNANKRWENHCNRVKERYNDIFKFSWPKLATAAGMIIFGTVFPGVGLIAAGGALLGGYTIASTIVKMVNKKRYGGPLLVREKRILHGSYLENISESLYERTNGKKISEVFDNKNVVTNGNTRQPVSTISHDESKVDTRSTEVDREKSAAMYTAMDETRDRVATENKEETKSVPTEESVTETYNPEMSRSETAEKYGAMSEIKTTDVTESKAETKSETQSGVTLENKEEAKSSEETVKKQPEIDSKKIMINDKNVAQFKTRIEKTTKLINKYMHLTYGNGKLYKEDLRHLENLRILCRECLYLAITYPSIYDQLTDDEKNYINGFRLTDSRITEIIENFEIKQEGSGKTR